MQFSEAQKVRLPAPSDAVRHVRLHYPPAPISAIGSDANLCALPLEEVSCLVHDLQD